MRILLIVMGSFRGLLRVYTSVRSLFSTVISRKL